MACGSDSQSGHAVALDELARTSARRSRGRDRARPSARRRGPRRRRAPGRSARPSRPPAGSRWRTARRRPARRSRRAGRRRRSHCRRPRSDSPAQVRGPPIERFTLAIDSPWRTSTRRRRRQLGVGLHRSGHAYRPNFSFRVPGPGRAPRRVGAVAPGPRPIHRFTVRSRDADPRAAAIAAGAASLGHRRSTAPVDVADLVFVEGDLDDADRRPPRRVPRRSAAADRHVGRRPTRPASRSRCTPASPTAPPTPWSTPPRQLGRAGDRGRHRPAHRVLPAGADADVLAAPARRQPDHRALVRRPGRARPAPRLRRRAGASR